MKKTVKRTLMLLVLIITLVGLSGCATTASLGLGYYVPISPHGRAGFEFGVGF